MWENLKKAWNFIKAGTLAVAAWIGEAVSTGDLASANRKFDRTYSQKRTEYSAGERFGENGARIVRSAANLLDQADDLFTGHGTQNNDAAREEATRRQNEADRAQAELTRTQIERRVEMEERHQNMRNKYDLKGANPSRQPVPMDHEHSVSDHRNEHPKHPKKEGDFVTRLFGGGKKEPKDAGPQRH